MLGSHFQGVSTALDSLGLNPAGEREPDYTECSLGRNHMHFTPRCPSYNKTLEWSPLPRFSGRVSPPRHWKWVHMLSFPPGTRPVVMKRQCSQ